jgi:hypothetical protein
MDKWKGISHQSVIQVWIQKYYMALVLETFYHKMAEKMVQNLSEGLSKLNPRTLKSIKSKHPDKM